MKSRHKYTVGTMVMYCLPEDKIEGNNGSAIAPAIIVHTWQDTSYENDEVNLKVLTDAPTDMWVTSVPHSINKEPNTWHWLGQ